MGHVECFMMQVPKNMRTKNIVIICTSIVLGTLLLLVGQQVYLQSPDYLKDYLVKRFESACDTCRLSIGSIDIRFLMGPVIFNDVRMEVGNSDITKYVATASQVVSHVNPFSFVNGQVNLRKVEVERPVVVITDGDGHSPPKKKEPGELKKFAIDEIKIRNGRFAYIRVVKGEAAKIQINDISGNISAFGTNKNYIDLETVAKTQARLEKSGSVDIEIKSKIFLRPVNIDLTLAIKDQNLSDINPYFDNNDGISLKGHLLEGKGKVSIRGRKSTSEVYAKYEGLKVEFRKTRDRGSIEAFFMRLGGNLFMDPSNKDERRFQQTEIVENQRGERDSLVKFILSGLKKGALNIARDTEGRKKNSPVRAR